MERTALINLVKTKIDEVSSSDCPINAVGIEDNQPYDSLIESLLDESAREILLKAPFYRLPIESGTPEIISDPNDRTIGYIKVPANFLKLVSFKMTEWKRPVTILSIKGDEISKRQSNIHIRGGCAKPVGVLSRNQEGVIIEFYSVKTNPQIQEFLYIKTDSAENINDAQMIDALTWICAGKVLSVLGQGNISNACYESAKGLLI